MISNPVTSWQLFTTPQRTEEPQQAVPNRSCATLNSQSVKYSPAGDNTHTANIRRYILKKGDPERALATPVSENSQLAAYYHNGAGPSGSNVKGAYVIFQAPDKKLKELSLATSKF
jgi:hypothetical protein